MNWKICLTSSLLFLWGCVSAPPEPDLSPTKVEVTQYVAYECGEAPGLSPVSFLDFKWRLYKFEGAQHWTLTAQDYENLGKNMATIIEGIKQLKIQRDFWRACIGRSQKHLAEWNKKNK